MSALVLKYHKYGPATEVVQLEEDQIPTPGNDQLLVKMLASPVNPADLITITGTYDVKPELPSVPGNEGVAEVVEIGSGVKGIKVGDWVTPYTRGLGTWRAYALFKETDAVVLPKQLPLALAATINVNPCTAYRMLKDFVELRQNDVIIQNAALSAVGCYVMQLCQIWGIRCVAMIRSRSNMAATIDRLKRYQPAGIIVEDQFEDGVKKLFEGSHALPRPKLALNCVGGESASKLVSTLANGGTLVTYGGLSGQPLTISTGSFIYKDIRLRGFWMTQWTKDNKDTEEKKKMWDDLIRLAVEGKIAAPEHEFVNLKTVTPRYVFENVKTCNKKFIFTFE